MDPEKRTILALVLIAIILFGYSLYIRTRGPSRPLTGGEPAGEVAEVRASGGEGAAPESVSTGLSPVLDSVFVAALDESLPHEVIVETDLYSARLTTEGARLTSFRLKEYDAQNGEVVELIPEDAEAILGLWIGAGEQGIDLSSAPFTTDVTELELSPARPEGEIRFVLPLAEGGEVVKRYRFYLGRYDLGFEVEVSEQIGAREYWLHWRPGLSSTERNRNEDLTHFAGLALMGDLLLKRGRRDLAKIARRAENEGSAEAGYVEEIGNVRWVGVRTKYFVATVVPQVASQRKVRLMALGTEHIGFELGGRFGESGRVRGLVYLGPIDYELLREYGLGMERIVDFGMRPIAPISKFVLTLLTWTHEYISNYGLIIILFSCIMKAVYFPLTHRGMRQMKEMQEKQALLQPKLNELKQKYKNDPQKLNQETMALYREQGVSPVGSLKGCLPMLLQLPIFWALFTVLRNTIELRRAPFMLWIRDLSEPDRLQILPELAVPVLPLVMGAVMLLQQRLTSKGTDPRQRMMGYMMPIVFTFLFVRFPAGLVLYWLVNSALSLGEQYLTHVRGPETGGSSKKR